MGAEKRCNTAMSDYKEMTKVANNHFRNAKMNSLKALGKETTPK